MTIWKFPLNLSDKQIISIPRDAKMLHAGAQGTQLCIWAIVNPDNELEGRIIHVVGTGYPCDAEWLYIGTSFVSYLVWHIFEEKRKEK